PAEWKLRYYLLPSLPALALVTAPAVLRLAAEPARRLSTRGLAVLAATATGLVALAFAARSLPLSPSDRSTLDALLRIVPGGPSAAAAGPGLSAVVVLVVGFPTLSAEGRLGNVARGRVVLLEVAAGRATAVGSPRSPSSAAERASRRS